MKHTFSSNICGQLLQSGYTLHKCPQENTWQILDKREVVMESRSKGDLMKKAAQEFKLDWRN